MDYQWIRNRQDQELLRELDFRKSEEPALIEKPSEDEK